MKPYLVGVTLLLALAACQASEPEKSAQPATSEQPAASMSESAAQAASAAKAEAEKLAAEAKAQAEKLAAQAKDQAAQAATAAKAQAEKAAAEAKARAAQAASTARAQAEMAAAQAKARAAAAMQLPAKQATPATPAAAPAPAAASGDVASGKALARKCAACHNFDARNKVGPGLGGVFNRAAGSITGYSYKFTAFVKPGKTWSWDGPHLAAWVCDSGKAVRDFTGDAAAKTKMPAQRICDAAKQADLIAYLKTL